MYFTFFQKVFHIFCDKCHTDPRFIFNSDKLTFLFITLKVQDIHVLYLFSKSIISFTFFAILFFEVPMWSTRFRHPIVRTPPPPLKSSEPPKLLIAERC